MLTRKSRYATSITAKVIDFQPVVKTVAKAKAAVVEFFQPVAVAA